MSDAKQPVNLCEVCRFAHNGHCFADPATDWCMKELLPRTAQAAPSDREKRLEEALHEAACSLETISAQAGRGECLEEMSEVRGYANSRATVARAALADTTNNGGG